MPRFWFCHSRNLPNNGIEPTLKGSAAHTGRSAEWPIVKCRFHISPFLILPTALVLCFLVIFGRFSHLRAAQHTADELFRIDGCVVHFSGCGGSVEGGIVDLSPLDRFTQVDMGWFYFDDVPPGDYTLTYSPRCNPAGCTRPIDVRILDADGYAAFYRYKCPGDCSPLDDRVTVDEIVSCVNIMLGHSSGGCFCDADYSGQTTIDDLVRAVDAFLDGCD